MNFMNYNYPKNFPEIISFLVTNKCVCRCKHCFNWQGSSSQGAIGNKGKKDLTLEEIKEIFEKFDEIDYLYIGGGEPFIRKDLFEILSLIYQHAKPKTINISTNGQFPDSAYKVTRDLLLKCPQLKIIIKVSIDGFGSAHDEIRQKKNAFNTAISTYLLVSKLKKQFNNLSVGVTTVFSSINQNSVFDIYRYLTELSPRPNCITQLLVRADPLVAECKEKLDLEVYREWTQMYVQHMLNGEFEEDERVKAAIILMYDAIYQTVIAGERQIACYAGIAGAVIDNEGKVYPCEHKQPYGSLREQGYDFKKIWHSKETEKMRQETFQQCFCTNEPQWWHPSVKYDQDVMQKGKNLLSCDNV